MILPWFDNKVYMYGFWATSQYCIHEIQRVGADDSNLLWDLTAKYIDTETQDENNLNKEQLDIVVYGAKIPDWKRRLRVLHGDMLKIKHHMLTGELMPKNVEVRHDVRDRALTVVKTPHPTAERHAINREKVLAAAIYVQTKFPEECETAVAWATYLDLHSMSLFGTEQPPLSQEQMTRLLGTARESGALFKKS